MSAAPDRSRLGYKLGYALRNPGRVLPYARRRSRDALIGMKASDHISYYRAVMKAETARNPEVAVGSMTHDSWLKVGQLQFDYLFKAGLQPGDRMLEIGCGDLRAGCSSPISIPATTSGSTSRRTSCSPPRTPSPVTTCRPSSPTWNSSTT